MVAAASVAAATAPQARRAAAIASANQDIVGRPWFTYRMAAAAGAALPSAAAKLPIEVKML